jgi:hypothetical protein
MGRHRLFDIEDALDVALRLFLQQNLVWLRQAIDAWRHHGIGNPLRQHLTKVAVSVFTLQ